MQVDIDWGAVTALWFEEGRRCGASDFEGWDAGWRDYHAGIHAPRVDRDDPDLEALWKEGYAAAFRTSPDAYQTEMRRGLKSWLALNVGEEAVRDLKTRSAGADTPAR